MAEGLHIDVIRGGDAVVLQLVGEFDMAGIRTFEEAVRASGDGPRLVVDLRQLRFMDSSALNALLAAAPRPGPRLGLVPGPSQVSRLFDLTSTWDQFELVEPLAPEGISTDDPAV